MFRRNRNRNESRRYQLIVALAIGVSTAGVAGLFAVDSAIAATEHASRLVIAKTLASVTVPATTSTTESAAAGKGASGASAAVPRPVQEQELEQEQVLTIGDSVMKGFGLASSAAWPALLARANGWELTTRACDGAGFITVGSAEECDDTFSGVASAAADLHPNLIIIQGSSNDYGQPNGDLAAATTATLALLRTEFPDARIIGLSAVWTDTLPTEQLAAINAQLASAVAAVGGSYVDIAQPLAGHSELMQGDDVHPTPAGQLVLADSIQTALDAPFDTAKTALLSSSTAAESGLAAPALAAPNPAALARAL